MEINLLLAQYPTYVCKKRNGREIMENIEETERKKYLEIHVAREIVTEHSDLIGLSHFKVALLELFVYHGKFL